MKNIIIVDAISTGRNYIKDVKRRNYCPIVLEPRISDASNQELLNERKILHKKYSVSVEYIDEKDNYEETLKMVRAYDPLLVIPGSEYGVSLATRLAEDLKLPGNPYANIEKFTSKVAMHNALKEYGIRYIKGKLVNSLEEAIEYYHEAKMDTCVIKPTRGAGSSSVHLCNNEEEMIEAVKQELNAVNIFGDKNQLLLQERINGTEYIVNTVSREGKHRLSSIWRYKKKRVQGGGNVYDYAELITRLETGHQELIRYAYDVANAIGYQNGAIHGEYMIDEKGPVLIEVNCRPMGANMTEEFLDDVLGHHETDNCLDSYLNPKWHEKMMNVPYRPYKKAYIKLFIAIEDMEIKMAPVVNLIRNLPSYFSGGVSRVSTGQLARTVDLETNSGVLFMKHENEYQLKKDVEFLRKVEKNYFDMFFVKDDKTIPTRPNNLENISNILSRYQYGRSTLILTNDEKLNVDATIIHSDDKDLIDGMYNCGILDIDYCENEDIESIIEDFYFLASKIHRGGHLLIPEKTYWHLPCKMESIDVLCETKGIILEAPVSGSGNTIVCTIP